MPHDLLTAGPGAERGAPMPATITELWARFERLNAEFDAYEMRYFGNKDGRITQTEYDVECNTAVDRRRAFRDAILGASPMSIEETGILTEVIRLEVEMLGALQWQIGDRQFYERLRTVEAALRSAHSALVPSAAPNETIEPQTA